MRIHSLSKADGVRARKSSRDEDHLPPAFTSKFADAVAACIQNLKEDLTKVLSGVQARSAMLRKCEHCFGCRRSCNLSFMEKYPRMTIGAICVLLSAVGICVNLAWAGV